MEGKIACLEIFLLFSLRLLCAMQSEKLRNENDILIDMRGKKCENLDMQRSNENMHLFMQW